MVDVVMLGCAAFLAGLVDAVVGGGGLIQLPVLFSMFPKEIPATLRQRQRSLCPSSARGQ
jgi:uncharacterized membrane protein YfcA